MAVKHERGLRGLLLRRKTRAYVLRKLSVPSERGGEGHVGRES